MMMRNHPAFWISLWVMSLTSYGFAPAHSAWQKISSGINENVIHCIAIHPQDNNIIFIAPDLVD